MDLSRARTELDRLYDGIATVNGIRLAESSGARVISSPFVEGEIENGTEDVVLFIDVAPQGRATIRRK